MSTISTSASTVPAKIPVRLAARAIDVLIVGVIDGLLGKLIGFGFDWLVISAVIVIAYFVLCDVIAGATLGKRALGLRVIGPGGDPPSLRQALARESFTMVGAVPYVGPLLAIGAWVWIIVTIRSSSLGQGGHDLLAGGTRVVMSEPRA
jgi:uncharacterized RDD family membrane protein YckC